MVPIYPPPEKDSFQQQHDDPSSSSSSRTESLLHLQTRSPPLPEFGHQDIELVDTSSKRRYDDADAPEEDEEELDDEDLHGEDIAITPRRHEAEKGQFAYRIPSREDVYTFTMGARPKRNRHPKLVALGLLALLAGAFAISQVLALGTRYGHGGPRINVILMISDGMGPASETMSRSFLSYLATTNSVVDPTTSMLNASVWANLAKGFVPTPEAPFGITPLDEMLVGTSRTRSSNSLITDSAAGATAFSAMIKTYNGAIAVEPVGKTPVGTILEAAKRQGFSTGLVSTSRVTHATPAAFYAHVVDRDLESEIAPFLVGAGPQGNVVDFAFGGGLCFFLPNSTEGSCRTDGRDVLAEAKANGATVLQGLEALDAWHDDGGHEKEGMVLGLFHSDHMDYEIDRQQIVDAKDQQPSLKQMAKHALHHLEGQEKKGFFLMVEGSRIDMAAHNNDPVGHMSDMLAYHTTVDFIKDWVDDANERGVRTVLISVSDHETGGLALGRTLDEEVYPEYEWFPDALVKAKHSTAWLGAKIAAQADPTPAWLTSEIYVAGLGIDDVSQAELDELTPHLSDAYRANLCLAKSISRRAQVGWSTVGHSGVDVNLYAHGFNSTGLVGNRENIEIGEHIAHMMGLQPEVVTLELNKDLSWHSTEAGRSPERRTKVAHYHGDF